MLLLLVVVKAILQNAFFYERGQDNACQQSAWISCHAHSLL